MTATDLTPEERVRRVKAALAEAGWPCPVEWRERAVRRQPGPTTLSEDCPLDVWWRALVVAGEQPPCWPCFQNPDESDWSPLMTCTHDPFHSEWPPVPSPSDNKEQTP